MRVIKEKHFYYDKDWFVFPFAIIWEDFLGMFRPPAKRLSIHFLCWHWQWTFWGKGVSG